ncbi:hypothetical protein BH24GEM1_BH24GEM1_09990 [soil metagenome]
MTRGLPHLPMVPLALLVAIPANRCELSTASGTGELRLVGTVHLLDAERSCWRLSTAEGGPYELQPEQAPPSMLRDAAGASVVARPSEGPETGCRAGMLIDVRRVVSVDLSE